MTRGECLRNQRRARRNEFVRAAVSQRKGLAKSPVELIGGGGSPIIKKKSFEGDSTVP